MRNINQAIDKTGETAYMLDAVMVYEPNESLWQGDICPPIYGMSKVSELTGVTYYDLESVLGEPTYPTPSEDGKTQKEWTLLYKDDEGREFLFYIYDYKTFSEDETMNTLQEWSVGGMLEDKATIVEVVDALKETIKSS